MNDQPHTPDLEERFLQPPGWEWGELQIDDRHLRYGYSAPSEPAKGIIVCLTGLSEFCEKYFETARGANRRGFEFWCFDWMGQGRSTRYLNNPHKRHSAGFQRDAEDLHALITRVIQPRNDGKRPLVMLAHSMGANIGFHYLNQHPDIFACAGMSAPLFGLKPFEFLPDILATALTFGLHALWPTTYVIGEADWRKENRPSPGNDKFSSDPERGAVHNAWCLADPRLQVGRITYTWLYEAQKSCMKINKAMAQSIKTPCLLGLSGHEEFVNNKKIRDIAKSMHKAKLLEFPDARHEILMENDAIRKLFMEGFYGLIQETVYADI